MVVCVADFVIFPVLWSLVQVIGDGKVETQWSPITLQGAGLFHMAMGAILGIAVYGRTQEKMAGVNNIGTQQSVVGVGSPVSTTNVWHPGSANTVVSTSGTGWSNNNEIPPTTSSRGKLIVPTGPEPLL